MYDAGLDKEPRKYPRFEDIVGVVLRPDTRIITFGEANFSQSAALAVWRHMNLRANADLSDRAVSLQSSASSQAPVLATKFTGEEGNVLSREDIVLPTLATMWNASAANLAMMKSAPDPPPWPDTENADEIITHSVHVHPISIDARRVSSEVFKEKWGACVAWIQCPWTMAPPGGDQFEAVTDLMCSFLRSVNCHLRNDDFVLIGICSQSHDKYEYVHVEKYNLQDWLGVDVSGSVSKIRKADLSKMYEFVGISQRVPMQLLRYGYQLFSQDLKSGMVRNVVTQDHATLCFKRIGTN